MQAPIIESKLSEVYVWGSGKQLPKHVEFFNKENAPLHVNIKNAFIFKKLNNLFYFNQVAAGSSHFAVINVEKELYTWSVNIYLSQYQNNLELLFK